MSVKMSTVQNALTHQRQKYTLSEMYVMQEAEFTKKLYDAVRYTDEPWNEPPDQLQCIICNHFPRNKILICHKGHSICEWCDTNCRKHTSPGQIYECSVCRDPMPGTATRFQHRAWDSEAMMEGYPMECV